MHPSIAKELARHSTIGLTMDHYTHTVIGERAEALKSLPDLERPEPDPERRRATGTADARPENSARFSARFSAQSGATEGYHPATSCKIRESRRSFGPTNKAETPILIGFPKSGRPDSNRRLLAPKAKGVASQEGNSQGLTNGLPNGCTDGCTGKPTESDSEGAEASDAGPAGEHFAEAVTMLARLPLTDAERADAVRRLLAGADSTQGA